MDKEYSYINYFSIANAMNRSHYKFTLLDFNILCLVKSFYKSEKDFYMSNEQISNLMFSCEKTVRTSIKRLCEAGLLKKQYIKNNKFNGRKLIYQEHNVNCLVSKFFQNCSVGVYIIKVGEYVYIGESLNVENRWLQHQDDLQNNIHPNRQLQSLYNQNLDFKFEILESIPFSQGHNVYFKLLNLQKEQKYIQQYKDNGYKILNTENSLERLKDVPELYTYYIEFIAHQINTYDDILALSTESNQCWEGFKLYFYNN